ncbi:unnamed protein product [Blepharisma stoltei]|uniref:Uncharacterized protein n=1 Tax=Blepharisma stoltei TaxID=1481888 RepID=A0AAU9JXV1_9CILI|nr:unnamed protein product [Blepharisma stoltei]
MAFRSLCRLGRILASKSTSRVSYHFRIQSHLAFQNRLISFNPIRYFHTDFGSIVEELQLKTSKMEGKWGENSPYLVIPYSELGTAYREWGDLSTSVSFFEKAIKIIENYRETDLIYLRNSYINLAHTYGNLENIENIENAIEYFQKSLNISKERFGNNSKEVSVTLYNIAKLYMHEKNIDKAYEHLQLALPFMETKAESCDEDVGCYFILHGHVSGLKFKKNRSINSFKTARKIFERISWQISNKIEEMDNHLELTYSYFGRFQENKPNLEFIENIRKTLGKPDESLKDPYKNYGFLYQKMKKMKKFDENIKEEEKIVNELGWDNSIYMAFIYNLSGNDLKSIGDTESCKYWFEKSLKILQAHQNSKTEKMVICYRNLSKDASDRKDYERAIEYCQKVIDLQWALEFDYNEIASSLVTLGSYCHAKGELIAAESHMTEAKQILEEKLIEDESLLEFYYSTLGLLYRDQGKYSESFAVYEKVLKFKAKNLGESHFTIADIHSKIGLIYEKWGKLSEAVDEYKKAISLNLKSLGRDHPNTSAYIDLLGNACQRIGNIEEAIIEHKAALDINRAVFEENSFRVGQSYSNLAFDYQNLRNWDQAIEFHNKSINVYKECYDNSRDIVDCYAGELIRLGETYEMKGDTNNALINYGKGSKIYVDFYGENHEYATKIQMKIDRVQNLKI